MLFVLSCNFLFSQGLSDKRLPVINAELQEGDVLYIPQMWWKQMTVQSSPSLVVHFEWPAKQEKSSTLPAFHRDGVLMDSCFVRNNYINKYNV